VPSLVFDIVKVGRQCVRVLATTDPQVAVVGGGPAGLAAAIEVARSGLDVQVFDERGTPGGPVYASAVAPTLLRELASAGPRALVHGGVTVWGLFDRRTLAWCGTDRADSVRPDALILAVGGSPRAVPIPGWTLEGVVVSRSVADEEAIRPGERVLVAGAGPGLAVVAAGLVRAGAAVVGVLDAAAARGMPRALALPWGRWPVGGDASADWLTLRAAGVRYEGSRTIARLVGAPDGGRVREAVIVALDDGWRPIPGSEVRVEIDAARFVWGSVPSIQLAQIAGAELHYVADAGGFIPVVSADMETTVPCVFAAGRSAGAEGAALAALQGRIAGIAAAARVGAITQRVARSRMRPYQAAAAPLRRAQAALGSLTAVRAGSAELITPDTLICPCEGITGAQVDQALQEGAIDLGQIKRATRVGMGRCRGLTCNPAVATLLAQRRGIPLGTIAPPSARAPVTSVPIHLLAAMPDA